MKIRKNLFLMVIFIFALAVMVVLPNKVFADEMSNEFKAILNEDGKLLVTDTTMEENKQQFLQKYIQKYSTNTYWFGVNTYDEENSICGISRNMIESTDGEGHDVEVVFEEKFSDEFKSILKDGKIEIKSSSKNITADYLENYVYGKSNEDYKFNIDSVSINEEPWYKKLVNEDFTKGTVVMSDNNGKQIERHIVEFSYITKQSEEFKKELNKDGKLEINSIKPTNEFDFNTLYELLVWKEGISCSNLAEDFTSCDLTVNGETHTVGIAYNYDKQIKEKLQSFVNNFPKDIEYFKVQDMELINYWINNEDNEENDTFTGYSGELKSYLNNYNVKLVVAPGAGMDGALVTERLGKSVITYNNVVYYINSMLGARGEHIIYVPSDTGNSKEELIAAAQKRIDEYIGKDKVKLSYSGTAYDAWLKQEYEYSKWMWEQEDPNMTFEQWKALGNIYIPVYENFEEVIMIEGITETDSVFNVTIGDKNHYVIIKKDSSKMITPSYATADMETNVAISSTDTSIPLDTSVKATKITSGAEYDKIMKVLNVENSETFDLKLYSESLEKYITKLEDGKFEVKIPVSNELEGKNLVAYYIDQNDKVTEHEVTVKDGYAIFTTDHFSIYTLAELKEAQDNKDDNKEDTTDNNNNAGANDNNTETNNNNNSTGANDSNNNVETSDKNNNNTANTDNNKDNSNNPKTGDNIWFFIVTLLIATIGIIATTVFRKYYKNK